MKMAVLARHAAKNTNVNLAT